MRVIAVTGDAAVLDAPHRFVNDGKRHGEPFFRLYRAAKAVGNGDVHLCRRKESMQQFFQFDAVDVGELVFGDDFHWGEEKGRVVFGIGDAGFHFAAGNADFVQGLAQGADLRLCREAAQDVDGAAFDVVGLKLAGKELRAVFARGDAPLRGRYARLPGFWVRPVP